MNGLEHIKAIENVVLEFTGLACSFHDVEARDIAVLLSNGETIENACVTVIGRASEESLAENNLERSEVKDADTVINMLKDLDLNTVIGILTTIAFLGRVDDVSHKLQFPNDRDV